MSDSLPNIVHNLAEVLDKAKCRGSTNNCKECKGTHKKNVRKNIAKNVKGKNR